MNKGSQDVILTLTVKVIRRSQVENCNNCEISGIENVGINIYQVYVMYATEYEEGHQIFSLTLTFKVSRQGQVINFGLFTHLQLVRIDT